MSSTSFADFESRLDELTTALLVPLRTKKVVNAAALTDMRQLLSDFAAAVAVEETVPKALVGKMLFVFTSILSEAQYARDPAPIAAAAWDIQEHLARVFGPRFD